ncbi:MAG: tail fiber domain-containing protein [Bacteroidia bacterium]
MKKNLMLVALIIIWVTTCCQTSIAQSWALTGNSGTNTSTNFIGTIDNVGFKIRTKNVNRITITNGGKVGIGINTPVFKLDVKGGSINTDSVYRIGGYSILSVTTSNTFVGRNVGYLNTGGVNNTGIGRDALFSLTAGNYNIAMGSFALYSNYGGDENCAIGYEALYSNTTGDYNIAFGTGALYFNTIGIDNIAIGRGALKLNKKGTGNVSIGRDALFNNDSAIFNTACGWAALNQNTTGNNNTALGLLALANNTTGDYNTAVGSDALGGASNATGDNNTAIGQGALSGNITGDRNTACGSGALQANSTGNYNTAIGLNAGTTNDNNTYCTFVGYDSRQVVFTDFTNSMALGNSSRITDSDQVRIGNTAITSIGGYSGWTTLPSDSRFKKNIQRNVPGLEFILKLKPVTYNLDVKGIDSFLNLNQNAETNNTTDGSVSTKEKIVYTGFVAQDVEAAAKEIGYDFSGVDAPKNVNDIYGLRYAEFVVPLVKAVQELSEKLTLIESILTPAQQQKLNELKNATETKLEQNSPNPFSDKTKIKFYIPSSASNAEIKVLSTDGKELKSINVASNGAGEIEVDSHSLAPGVYNYTLTIDGKTIESKQMMVVK